MRHRQQHFARAFNLLGNTLLGLHPLGFADIATAFFLLFALLSVVPSFRAHLHDFMQILHARRLIRAPVGGQGRTIGHIIRMNQKIAK